MVHYLESRKAVSKIYLLVYLSCHRSTVKFRLQIRFVELVFLSVWVVAGLASCVRSLVRCFRAYSCVRRYPIHDPQITNRSANFIGLPLLAALREFVLLQALGSCKPLSLFILHHHQFIPRHVICLVPLVGSNLRRQLQFCSPPPGTLSVNQP